MEILQIKNLTFSYPGEDKKVLNDISLSIKEGDFVVLAGESGCGKSTFLRLLKKELAPFGEISGEIIYDGLPQDNIDERKSVSDIGFVLQNPEMQIVTDKVWHELAFGLESLGYPSNVIRRRVAEMAGYFGIEQWFDKDTFKLSGGQKQMLNLASVMVMQPKVLLLDEPTAQLDPIAATNFIRTLQKLNQELGLTIILAEHRLEEAFLIADKVIVMSKGEIDYYDEPRNIAGFLKNNPNHTLSEAVPAPIKVYKNLYLKNDGRCPLSVKEGRNYITDNYDNRIKELETDLEVKENGKVFELKNVNFRYEKDSKDILNNISISVNERESFCILGGNGAGKTTLLSVMAGLLRPYYGEIKLYGKKINKKYDASFYRKNIAMLPQNPQDVFLENTVRGDFREVCKVMGYKKEAEKYISDVAVKMQITNLLDKHPYDLSGGEQQKAALAKILLLQPKILLLDEPTKGIDAYYKKRLSDIIKELKKDGITIIMVTHDVEFAAINADRCAMIFNGEVVSVDKPKEFFTDNNFYTTQAYRMVRGYYNKSILCEEIIKLCELNGRKNILH